MMRRNSASFLFKTEKDKRNIICIDIKTAIIYTKFIKTYDVRCNQNKIMKEKERDYGFRSIGIKPCPADHCRGDRTYYFVWCDCNWIGYRHAGIFDAGLIILIPLAFSLAKRTNRSSLFYVVSGW